MFWDDDQENKAEYNVPDHIVDVCYQIQGRAITIDHGMALSKEVIRCLPWFEDEPLAGLHQIHVAESGNGWFRPQDSENELLYLSRRTKLALRLPHNRLQQAEELIGQKLKVAGHELLEGKSSIRKLSKTSIVFSRYVIGDGQQSEQTFLEHQYKLLMSIGIKAKKMLCGKEHRMTSAEGTIYARSLMLAELDYAQAVIAQESGIGPGRKFGCGIFLPHKGIAAIKGLSEQIKG